MFTRFSPANPVTEGPDGRPLREGRYLSAARLDAGLVLCLDGIGGYNWLPRLLRRGLDQGGVPHAIVIYNWSIGPLGLWVTDLVARRRNRKRARELAEVIATYRARRPDRPVVLIGHSGGGGLAAWVLEALPAGCQVDRAILLAPALAPHYNLSRALRGVRENLYVGYSWADFGLMGLGTSLFGSIDRHHGPCAGLVGFRLTGDLEPAERAAYARVRQIGWGRRLMRYGHFGDHTGWTNTRFAREFLAPVVLGKSDPGDVPRE